MPCEIEFLRYTGLRQCHYALIVIRITDNNQFAQLQTTRQRPGHIVRHGNDRLRIIEIIFGKLCIPCQLRMDT